MAEKSWQNRTTPAPTLEELDAKTEARLRFLEDELRKKGMRVVGGAEQEFFVLDEHGKPMVTSIDVTKLKENLESTLLKDVSILKQVYREIPLSMGLYEIVLGEQNNPASFYSSPELAAKVEELRRKLPSRIDSNDDKTPLVSFAPMLDHDDAATAGLHFNWSLRDTKGNNLFYSESTWQFSNLAHATAQILTTLQREGLGLYTPTNESYKRFGKHHDTPKIFGTSVRSRSAGRSIVLRDQIYLHKELAPTASDEKYFRLEDKLASADANPWFVALAGVGAMYAAALNKVPPLLDKPAEKTVKIPRHPNPQKAIAQFEHSDLWKTIAGEELHADIVAYCKAQAQSKVVTSV